MVSANCNRLAYCELYVSLGTLFRRFRHLKSNTLTPDDLWIDDNFTGYHPIKAMKFHVTNEEMRLDGDEGNESK
jgi:hypothetical protein